MKERPRARPDASAQDGRQIFATGEGIQNGSRTCRSRRRNGAGRRNPPMAKEKTADETTPAKHRSRRRRSRERREAPPTPEAGPTHPTKQEGGNALDDAPDDALEDAQDDAEEQQRSKGEAAARQRRSSVEAERTVAIRRRGSLRPSMRKEPRRRKRRRERRRASTRRKET